MLPLQLLSQANPSVTRQTPPLLWCGAIAFCRGRLNCLRSGWCQNSLGRSDLFLVGRPKSCYRSTRDSICIFLHPSPMVIESIRANEDFILRAFGVGGRVRRDKLEGLGRKSMGRARRCKSCAWIWPRRYGSRLVHVLLVDIIRGPIEVLGMLRNA